MRAPLPARSSRCRACALDPQASTTSRSKRERKEKERRGREGEKVVSFVVSFVKVKRGPQLFFLFFLSFGPPVRLTDTVLFAPAYFFRSFLLSVPRSRPPSPAFQ